MTSGTAKKPQTSNTRLQCSSKHPSSRLSLSRYRLWKLNFGFSLEVEAWFLRPCSFSDRGVFCGWGSRQLGRSLGRGWMKPVFEKRGHVALDGLELVELQIGINDREQVARGRLLIDENPLPIAENLLFDFEEALAFEHDRQDVTGGNILRIVQSDKLAQQRFGGLSLNRIGRRRWRLIDALPIGDKAFALARTLAVLLLPARGAHIAAAEVGFLVEQQGMIR